MKRGLVIGSFLAVAVTAAAWAIDSEYRTVTINEHRFKVPVERLDVERPFFLPPWEGRSISFVLNPQAPLPDQVSVLVERRQAKCAPKGQNTPYLEPACEGHLVWIGQNSGSSNSLNKRQMFSDTTFLWNYVAETDAGEEVVVASCVRHNPSMPALCSAVAPYGGAILEVGFSEDQIPELRSHVLRAQAQLQEWEVRP